MVELHIPVQRYILWDVAWVPRGSVKNTSPMCHSPLRHGLRQATHNTLWLGSWSAVSYLFRDRHATRTGPPGYPPPSDVHGRQNKPQWKIPYLCKYIIVKYETHNIVYYIFRKHVHQRFLILSVIKVINLDTCELFTLILFTVLQTSDCSIMGI
jgi:hypothetical protein